MSCHPLVRVVISTCPLLPPGSHGDRSCVISAPSKTSSHRPRVRSSASTTSATVFMGALASAQSSGPAKAATWSVISPACSAEIHHTMSYQFANRCAYSMASCVLPIPPMPCNAWTTARWPLRSRSRRVTRSMSRPVNRGFRVGTRQARGNVPGKRGPIAPIRLSWPDVPCPTKGGSCPGWEEPRTASRSTPQASLSDKPNRSWQTNGLNIPGISSPRTLSVRSCIRCRASAPVRCTSPDHSSGAYRDGLRYSEDHRLNTRSPRFRPFLIFAVKFCPVAQSQTSRSTWYPASVRCHATHSAQARSEPAWLTITSFRPLLTWLASRTVS